MSRVPPSTGPADTATEDAVGSVVAVGLAFEPEQPEPATTAIDVTRKAPKRATRTRRERGAFTSPDCTRPTVAAAVAGLEAVRGVLR